MLKLKLILLLFCGYICAVLSLPAYGDFLGTGRAGFGGRSYKDIAMIINPDQYVFVRERPYPGQPFWPEGKK